MTESTSIELRPGAQDAVSGQHPSGRPGLRAVPGGREEPARRPSAAEPEPLWREVLGERLRGLRTESGETLAETAARAGISPQYLSEVERGRKEPSSEMIAALAGALGTSLGELAGWIAGELRSRRYSIAAPHATAPVNGLLMAA